MPEIRVHELTIRTRLVSYFIVKRVLYCIGLAHVTRCGLRATIEVRLLT